MDIAAGLSSTSSLVIIGNYCTVVIQYTCSYTKSYMYWKCGQNRRFCSDIFPAKCLNLICTENNSDKRNPCLHVVSVCLLGQRKNLPISKTSMGEKFCFEHGILLHRWLRFLPTNTFGGLMKLLYHSEKNVFHCEF